MLKTGKRTGADPEEGGPPPPLPCILRINSSLSRSHTAQGDGGKGQIHGLPQFFLLLTCSEVSSQLRASSWDSEKRGKPRHSPSSRSMAKPERATSLGQGRFFWELEELRLQRDTLHPAPPPPKPRPSRSLPPLCPPGQHESCLCTTTTLGHASLSLAGFRRHPWFRPQLTL